MSWFEPFFATLDRCTVGKIANFSDMKKYCCPHWDSNPVTVCSKWEVPGSNGATIFQKMYFFPTVRCKTSSVKSGSHYFCKTSDQRNNLCSPTSFFFSCLDSWEKNGKAYLASTACFHKPRAWKLRKSKHTQESSLSSSLWLLSCQ